MRLFVFLTMIPMAQVAFGDQSDSTHRYADDLATIHGDIQQVQAWEEVCSKEFPSTMNSNKRAVERWREQHSSFVLEIERYWMQWLSDESLGDPKRKDALMAKFQALYEVARNSFHQTLLADGHELFRKRCENYPRYLISPSMNLEAVHAERVRRLRAVTAPESVSTKEALLARALKAMTFAPSAKKGLLAQKQRNGTNRFIEDTLLAPDAQLERVALSIYAKYLSQQQIEEILRFYESAAGRSLVAQQTQEISNPRPILTLQPDHAAEARAFTSSTTGKVLAMLTGSQAIWTEIGEALRADLAK